MDIETNKYAAYHRQYYLAHKEKIELYKKEWRKKHPGYANMHRKKSYQKNKRMLQKLKTNGCAKCGYNKYNACLEFHHVNPENKKFYITVDTMGRKDLTDELNKCILLCNRCHREIHTKEIQDV